MRSFWLLDLLKSFFSLAIINYILIIINIRNIVKFTSPYKFVLCVDFPESLGKASLFLHVSHAMFRILNINYLVCALKLRLVTFRKPTDAFVTVRTHPAASA